MFAVVGDTGNVYAKPEGVERRETYQRETITFDLAAYAQLELQLDLTADINNLELTLIFNLAGAGASLKLNARTILRAQQQLKIITQQNHLAAATTSDVLLKTVCFDQSQWAYDGKIFVAATGHQTVASQLNHNLLVSTINAPIRPNSVASGCAAPVILPARQSAGSATVPDLALANRRPGAPQAHSIPALE
ncbi:MAG TPA: SufD family Fe-S cluster assembly protein, partial [Candidatus Babeliales bacterium]|nr:SufD family Fe-S cluster assembly protein [Candidatus Babeliales bacterium]